MVVVHTCLYSRNICVKEKPMEVQKKSLDLQRMPKDMHDSLCVDPVGKLSWRICRGSRI